MGREGEEEGEKSGLEAPSPVALQWGLGNLG